MSEFILKKMNEWEFLKLKRKRESLKFELKEINQKMQREEEIRESIKYFKSFKCKRRIRKYFFRL